MNKRAETIGDGVATTFTIFHGFQTRDVVISLWNLTTGDDEYAGCGRADDNNVVISFSTPPPKDSYRVVVIG